MTKSSAHELDTLEIEPDIKPGERLHNARVAANMSIEEVARNLNLNSATVRNLEAEEYQELPGPTFVRGYLKAYARLLGIHPEPILEAFDKRGFEPPKLVDLTHTAQAKSTDFVFRISTFFIVLVLGTLVIAWWQSQRVDPDSEVTELRLEEPGSDESLATGEAAGEAGSGQDMSTAPLRSLAAVNDGTNDNLDTGEMTSLDPELDGATPHDQTSGFERNLDGIDSNEEQTESIDELSPPRPLVEPTLPMLTPTSVTEPHDAEVAPETVPDSTIDSAKRLVRTTANGIEVDSSGTHTGIGPLRLDAEGIGEDRVTIRLAHDSWVEAFDTQGKRLYYDLAREGHTLELKGAGPISVLLGYGRDAQVKYNGEPFDHSPYLRHDVARFTVGEGIQRSVE